MAEGRVGRDGARAPRGAIAITSVVWFAIAAVSALPLVLWIGVGIAIATLPADVDVEIAP